MIRNHMTRVVARVLACGVMLVSAARAQVEIGQNTNVSLSGDVGFGYNGGYGNTMGSDHGLALNGDGNLTGYYYNPRFLNFYVTPVYNRSQANSGQGSITDATNISAGVNLFAGSHFPGSISYGEAFNNSGNYGYGVTPGLTTTGNAHSLGLGWAALVPGLPPLSVQYTQTATESSLFGTDSDDHSSTRNLNLFSNYKVDGWFLGARFNDTWEHTELPSLVTDGETIIGNNNSKTFSLNGSHKLPLRGSLGAGYSWSDFGGTDDGVGTSGSNQTLNATAAFSPTQRFSTSFQANYDTNLSGAVEQQLLNAGAVVPGVNLGTNAYSVSLSNFDNVVLTKSLSAGFTVGHVDQHVYGETVSATHFSGVLNYRFLKPLWGSIVLYAGVNDQESDSGNTGPGLVSGANFNKQWSNFEVSGSFSYSQDVQTVLATQVTSDYSYLASASRRLARRVKWYANFNGFHTGLGQLAGSSAHAESWSSNLSFKMYNVGANYSRSTGTALLTANGLVAAPGSVLPVLTGNQTLLNKGSAYAFTATANPVRRLVVSAAYSKAISDSSGGTYPSFGNGKILNVFTEYQFRKISFNAGYTNFKQYESLTGGPPANFTNFYVGLQRWFKAF